MQQVSPRNPAAMTTMLRISAPLFFVSLSCTALAQTPTSVDIQLIRSSTPGRLEVQVRANGASFQDVLSGLFFTIRWATTSTATLGTRTNTCPTGIPLTQQPIVVNPSVGGNPTYSNYCTYSSVPTSPLSDDGCSLPQGTWYTVMTVPVTGDVGCTVFQIVNDAYTAPNNKNYFCSLQGVDRTGSITPGAASLCKVDITMAGSATPGSLDVRVRVNGASFNQVVSGLFFTIRWASTSSASLGNGTTACLGGLPFQALNQQTNGGYKYRTYAALATQPLSETGCLWPADQWQTVITVPALGNSACTAFSLINDAFTAANNENFFCSLNGNDLTGNIVANQIWLCGLDCQGVANGPAVPGATCNDGVACTLNDVWSTACVCAGISSDTDGDGTCNALDGCPTDAAKIAPGSCGCGNLEPGSVCNDGNTTTYADVIAANCACTGSPGCLLTAKAFLEGPYNSVNARMSDNLRVQGWLPSSEPYTLLGYSFVGGGGETVSANVFNNSNANSAKVDWVIVELRSAANPATVVASRAAVLSRDGKINDLDGNSPTILLKAPPGALYYVAVRHRNHLGVMTATAQGFAANVATTVDFSFTGTACYGTAARKNVSGVETLWAGDANFNGQIKYTGNGNDRDPILTTVGSTTPNNTAIGYSNRDVNMDGQIRYTGTTNDRDPILVNVGSTTPNNVRVQQVP